MIMNGRLQRLGQLLHLLGLIVERVDHMGQLFENLNCVVEGLVVLYLFEHREAPSALIKRPFNFLVKNHLAELLLDALHGEADLLGDEIDLHFAVRLDDLLQVVLKEGIVKVADVHLQDVRVRLDFLRVRLLGSLKGQKVLLLYGLRDLPHALEVPALVLQAQLRVDDVQSVVGELLHDLRHEHVLESLLREVVLSQRVEPLEALVEVRVRSVKVLLLCGDHPALHIDLRLQVRHDVNRRARCFHGGQRGL
mmetsp:Transcript_18739/g.21536  ORF Transcript_18739/g.21536 Transcript_18739/m.21536 type:complete len:251 (-) Transcript_18739:577-1329(-)